jgi:hypothetical protein
MIKKTITSVLIVFALFSMKQAQANELVDLLMSKLGVTELQANAGTGVLFKYLKSQVTGDEFDAVSDAVEGGASSYMRAADEAGAYKKTPSKFGKMGSAVTAPGLIGNATEPFKKLGLKGEMITKYADVIVDYFKQKGKEKATNVFMKMLS